MRLASQKAVLAVAVALIIGGSAAYVVSGLPPAHAASADSAELSAALTAVHGGDLQRARSIRDRLSDPVAQKLITWAMVDQRTEGLSPDELIEARRMLMGWPHASKRNQAAERAYAQTAHDPKQVLAFFEGTAPASAEGALMLAEAFRSLGRGNEAKVLIKTWWREIPFDPDVQSQMTAQFGDALEASDHAARLEMLLFGGQSSSAKAMLPMLPPEMRAPAEARMAMRSGARDAEKRYNALSPAQRLTPGVVYERLRWLRGKKRDAEGFSLVKALPSGIRNPDLAKSLWIERKSYMMSALRVHSLDVAYGAAANAGFARGEQKAEAEFYAGWLALRRMNNPALAAKHFAELDVSGSTPVTKSRAAYWRGRAAEAQGLSAEAKSFYTAAAQYPMTFYGQLASEKIGVTRLSLGSDPVPAEKDRIRFEAREFVKAMRLLGEAGDRDIFRSFALNLADNLPDAEEYALLVDLARGYNEADVAMRVVRLAYQHGYAMPERGYPVTLQPGYGPETALTLAIIRQESGFDPAVRSPGNARGLMQVEPGTAKGIARRIGLPWSEERLYEPDYNLRIGGVYLQKLVERFGGSYAMAAAGYNAGPSRPENWASDCGDPRGTQSDPTDFIECVPFGETRNYILSVMANLQVFRSRLSNGKAPLSLMADLKRGAYGVAPVAAGADDFAPPAAPLSVPDTGATP